ncbi:MAG TPA: CpsD/CapB family tyrosine-protein kinase [Candidatus Eisenbacteria bacterium]|nr:CpsD/CapB family tyrosine-protein kinase [Candidatus Eisenbacteria bacterium]
MAPPPPKQTPTLFDAFDVDTPVVTEVRRLLQNLARQSRNGERKVFLITSAGRGEGKTTISGLLALVSAQVFRKRTLLIDTDLRRPAVHSLLGVAQSPGLVDLFRGKISIETALRPTPVPTFWVISSGKVAGSAGSAYNDDAFASILTTLRPRYDIIFVDSAPVVPVIEPLLMAEHVDAMLLVSRAGKTPVTMIRRMKQLVAPYSDKVVGGILNNASDGLPYYYDYSYYGYQKNRSRNRVRREVDPTTENTETPVTPAADPKRPPGES